LHRSLSSKRFRKINLNLTTEVDGMETIALFSVGCHLLVFLAVVFLPETKGLDLNAIDDQAQLAKRWRHLASRRCYAVTN
jgi:hypothetical protein